MIVKIRNESHDNVRLTDCVSACVVPDNDGPGGKECFIIIYDFSNGKDATYPLSPGDKIYFMNDSGRTIDKDFRMCG